MSPKQSGKKAQEPLQIGNAKLMPGEMLRLKSEFNYVREHGEKFVGRYMLLIPSPSADDQLRFGIICGKKYSKKAVLRNRARRLLKESFRLLKGGLIPRHCLLIARQSMLGISLQNAQEDMMKLLGKAGMWKEEKEY
jgi:ribonuclease P protein component